MSEAMVNEVIATSRHKGSDLFCLVMLAHVTDDDGDAYPKVIELARLTRMSKRSIQRITRKLESSGELVVERNRGGTNHYRICLASLKGLDDLGTPSGVAL